MGQSNPSQWWDVVSGILTIPNTILGMIAMYFVIQKTIFEKPKNILEQEKLRLEKRILELDILERESKLRRKRKLNEPVKDNRLKSVLEKILLDIEMGEKRITHFLMQVLSPFSIIEQQKPEVSINKQRVVGSLIELFFLLLFIYTDLNQSANTLAVLIPISVPPFLTNLAIPLFISTAGTFVLGLMMGDLLGVTNLTSWADLREKRQPFLTIIFVTIIINLILSALLAIRRLSVIQNVSPSILAVTSLADSLFIIPSLITTSLLFNGIQGMLVLLALPIFVLRLPITVLRKIVTRFVYYVSD